MCICIHIYICACNVCMHVCMYACMYVRTYVCMHACMHVCMSLSLSLSLPMYMYIYIYIESDAMPSEERADVRLPVCGGCNQHRRDVNP